jgi:hypothetical protein
MVIMISFTMWLKNSTKTTLILCYWSQKYGRSHWQSSILIIAKTLKNTWGISIVTDRLMTLVKNPIYLLDTPLGLTASSYMNTGAERNRKCSYFKFAFLDFYQSGFEVLQLLGFENYFHNSSVCKKLKVLTSCLCTKFI